MSNYKKLSIIIPAFNESKTIEKIYKKVQTAKAFNLDKEIIIINDGSVDETKFVLKNPVFSKAKIISLEKNSGKGAALRKGFELATGDIILVQDADLEYNPDEYENLLAPILQNEADVVYGSRFISDRPRRVLYYWHSIGNQLITCISNIFTNLNLSDMETCYKVFRAEVLKQILPTLRSNRFGFEPEITAKIARFSPKLKIYEVGISYAGRTYEEEGKKITWKDAIETIYLIVKYNLYG